MGGTKLAFLREAVAKAHGFKNMSSYASSFLSLNETIECLDPHTYCAIESNLLVVQGRLDGLINVSDGYEQLKDLPMEDLVYEINHNERFVQWEMGLRKFDLHPLLIGNELYVRGYSGMDMYDDIDDWAVAFESFLFHQPRFSEEFLVYRTVAECVRERILLNDDGAYLRYLCDRFEDFSRDRGLDASEHVLRMPSIGLPLDIGSLAMYAEMQNNGTRSGVSRSVWNNVLSKGLPKKYRNFLQHKFVWEKPPFELAQSSGLLYLEKLERFLDTGTISLLVLIAEEQALREAMFGLRDDPMTPELIRKAVSSKNYVSRVMAGQFVGYTPLYGLHVVASE